ncbi:MAG: Rv2231c family pyridoxal phosphate-dependent protein CobC [Mycobacteriales bacterium]
MTTVDLHHHGDAELGPGLADFAVNVRPGTPPAWLRERLRTAVDDVAAYPSDVQARQVIAARHGRQVAEVLVTAGAAEAFVLLARAMRPRHAVVVHPAFTEPEAALRSAGVRVDRLLLSGSFDMQPHAVPHDADFVVLGNPTNPTGVLHSRRTIEELRRPGRVLVVDEAFMDFVPGEAESLAGDPQVVVTRSLTKMWGLAGARVGYVLAPSAIVTRLAAARPPWATSTFANVAVEACLTPAALHEAHEAAAEIAVEASLFAGSLAEIPGVTVLPTAANFLLLHAPTRDDVHQQLRRRGFAVRRCDSFPGLSSHYIRVAVRDARSNEALVAALRATMG